MRLFDPDEIMPERPFRRGWPRSAMDAAARASLATPLHSNRSDEDVLRDFRRWVMLRLLIEGRQTPAIAEATGKIRESVAHGIATSVAGVLSRAHPRFVNRLIIQDISAGIVDALMDVLRTEVFGEVAERRRLVEDGEVDPGEYCFVGRKYDPKGMALGNWLARRAEWAVHDWWDREGQYIRPPDERGPDGREDELMGALQDPDDGLSRPDGVYPPENEQWDTPADEDAEGEDGSDEQVPFDQTVAFFLSAGRQPDALLLDECFVSTEEAAGLSQVLALCAAGAPPAPPEAGAFVIGPEPERTTRANRWRALSSRVFVGLKTAGLLDEDRDLAKRIGDRYVALASSRLVEDAWLSEHQRDLITSQRPILVAAQPAYEAAGFLCGREARRTHLVKGASTRTWGTVTEMARTLFNLQAGIIASEFGMRSLLEWYIAEADAVREAVARSGAAVHPQLETLLDAVQSLENPDYIELGRRRDGFLPDGRDGRPRVTSAPEFSAMLTVLADNRRLFGKVLGSARSDVYQEAPEFLSQFESGKALYAWLSELKDEGAKMPAAADYYFRYRENGSNPKRLDAVVAASKSDNAALDLAILEHMTAFEMSGRLSTLLAFVCDNQS